MSGSGRWPSIRWCFGCCTTSAAVSAARRRIRARRWTCCERWRPVTWMHRSTSPRPSVKWRRGARSMRSRRIGPRRVWVSRTPRRRSSSTWRRAIGGRSPPGAPRCRTSRARCWTMPRGQPCSGPTWVRQRWSRSLRRARACQRCCSTRSARSTVSAWPSSFAVRSWGRSPPSSPCGICCFGSRAVWLTLHAPMACSCSPVPRGRARPRWPSAWPTICTEPPRGCSGST